MEIIESLFFTVIYINNLLWVTELILFQKGNKEIRVQYTENNNITFSCFATCEPTSFGNKTSCLGVFITNLRK